MSEPQSISGLTRREFLALSAVSALALPAIVGAVDTPAEAAAPAADKPADDPWYERMRRCGQINFNEEDPLTLDVESWMDYWASLKVDAVLLNGGGIMAFYPTAVAYHHRSAVLGTRDLFGEMSAAARKRRIRVVARMDCNSAYDEALQAHPEWFQRDRDGSVRKREECPWLYQTCMFGPYFTDQMPAIYREMNERYAPDAFFTNGWPSTDDQTVCYCENCQAVYRDKVGGVPPETPDPANTLYRKFYVAYMDRILSIWRLWDSVVKEDGRNSVYVGNLGGGIQTTKDIKALGDVAGWFNADNQGRSFNSPIWGCAQQGRVAQSVMGGRAITNVTGGYSNGAPNWRHSSKSAAEATLWMAQTTASGMVPWYHWLGGSPEDTRWRETGRSFYQWLAANEPHFRNRRSIADLAVLYPQSAIAFDRPGTRNPPARSSDHLQGLYYALLEGRFIFDFVHQGNLAAGGLGKYRALLIPNASYLRDDECDAIRAYAAAGGSVMATFETSLYDEWGNRRPDFALADLFGAGVAGPVIGPYGNSYMRIETAHDVVKGFDGTTLLPGPEYRIPVKAHDAGKPALTVVPYYPIFPPEMVYPRTPHTTDPAAIFRETGAGRVAYYPGDLERTCWRSGNVDLSNLIGGTVRWLLHQKPQPVTVDGDGVAEIFPWETEPGYALHVVNYTNPNMTRGAVRRFYEIGPQTVRFDIAPGRKIARVDALRSARSLKFRQTERSVQFEIPGVVDYEVIALT